MKGNSKPVKVLPLYLAAKRSRADAFKVLLKLGARVDDLDVDIRQLNNLMKCLRRPVNFPLLEAFLEARLDSQIRTRQCSEVAWPLIPAIRSGASLDFVRLLLDRGANPNQLHFCQGFMTMSPLSAAIMANSAPIFNLLLERGAKIDGTDYRDPTRRALHIPVFAAAQAMARHAHGRQMMQLCLDNGADINRRASSMFYSHKYTSRDTTPVLIYLDSIEKWQADPDTGRGPVEGLTYLLEHGASLKSSTEPFLERPICGRYWAERSPKLLDFLVTKWGSSHLSIPEFSATIVILGQRGTVDTSEMVMEGWNDFLTLLPKDQQADITRLLGESILIPGGPTGGRRRWKYLGAVCRTMIDHALAARADINALVPSALLHALCRHYRDVRRNYGRSTVLYQMRCEETSLLLSKGADPTITFDGKTAIDILESELKHSSDESNRTFILGFLSGMREEEASSAKG